MLWLSRVSIFNIWTLMVCGLLSSAVAYARAKPRQLNYATLPEVPTFVEAGLSGFYEQKRMPDGILTPTGTPQSIIDKLATLISGFVAQADFQAVLVQQGLVPHVSTPKQYAD